MKSATKAEVFTGKYVTSKSTPEANTSSNTTVVKAYAAAKVKHYNHMVVKIRCCVRSINTSIAFGYEYEPYRRLFSARVITSKSVARVILRGGDPNGTGYLRSYQL